MTNKEKVSTIFHFVYTQLGHEITKEHFLECFKDIKTKAQLLELAVDFKSITSRDMWDLISRKLPHELLYQIDEILLLNSLSFFQRIIYKLKKLFKKIIPEESNYKIVKGKLILTLKKKSNEDEWDKLTA